MAGPTGLRRLGANTFRALPARAGRSGRSLASISLTPPNVYNCDRADFVFWKRSGSGGAVIGGKFAANNFMLL